MSVNTAKKDLNLLYLAIYVVIVALFFFVLPPFEPITKAGMRLLGIFLAAIIGWSITSEIWPSLLTFLLLPFTGLVNLSGVLSLSYGSDMGLMVVVMMVFVAYLEASSTTNYVASYLMTRKMLVGHPWRLIFMIFLIAYLISSFCGNFPGMLITWSFVYSISRELGYKPYDKFPSLLVFGIAVMGALSLSAVPWANNALVILNSYAASSGTPINYAHYLFYSVPYGIFSILAFLLLCKFIFRLDVSKLKNFKPDFIKPEDLVLTTERKIALVSLLTVILLYLVPSILPAGNAIRAVFDQMGLSLRLVIVMIVLSLIKVNGKHIFHFSSLAAKGVPWDMVMMLIGILSFVGLLSSPDAGISAFLAKTLTPLFQNHGVAFLFFITVIVTVILTNFMINMVVAVIMISAVVPIAASLGVDPLQIVYLITITCTIAFALPAASAASCVLFANKEWIKPADIYKYSLPTIIVLTLIAVFWNLVVFMF